MNTKHNVFAVLAILIIGLSMACKENYYTQGKMLYEFHCANCHMEDGSGLEDVIPSISNSSYFNERRDEFTCLLINGTGVARTDGLEMPSFIKLNNVELLNITNYLNAKWSTDFSEYSILDLEEERIACTPTDLLQ
jgi:mono/diheme cytochrome c family protein